MSTPKRYRKKPVVIEAIQWKGGNGFHLADWCGGRVVKAENPDDTKIVIPTMEGDITASHDDYIIRGVQGEFYPCKSDIFEATYERVADDERTDPVSEVRGDEAP